MDVIESLIILLIVAAIIIAVIKWLGPTVGIPGNIIYLLCALVVVYVIFRVIGMLGAF